MTPVSWSCKPGFRWSLGMAPGCLSHTLICNEKSCMFKDGFHRAVKHVHISKRPLYESTMWSSSNTEDCWGLDEEMHTDDSSLLPHTLFQQFVIEGSKSLILGQLSHHRLSRWQERDHSGLTTTLWTWRNSFVISLTEAGVFQKHRTGWGIGHWLGLGDAWCPVGPGRSNHLEKGLRDCYSKDSLLQVCSALHLNTFCIMYLSWFSKNSLSAFSIHRIGLSLLAKDTRNYAIVSTMKDSLVGRWEMNREIIN